MTITGMIAKQVSRKQEYNELYVSRKKADEGVCKQIEEIVAHGVGSEYLAYCVSGLVTLQLASSG
jgi:hypothetical protein